MFTFSSLTFEASVLTCSLSSQARFCVGRAGGRAHPGRGSPLSPPPPPPCALVLWAAEVLTVPHLARQHPLLPGRGISRTWPESWPGPPGLSGPSAVCPPGSGGSPQGAAESGVLPRGGGGCGPCRGQRECEHRVTLAPLLVHWGACPSTCEWCSPSVGRPRLRPLFPTAHASHREGVCGFLNNDSVTPPNWILY